MKKETVILHTPANRHYAKSLVDSAPDGWIVTFSDPKRSNLQNALLHMHFGEIARQRGDCTMIDVKGEMHKRYGLAIRLRDPQFAWLWERTGARMNHEQQERFLASEAIAFSSAMSKPELKEYMDAMQLDMRAEGYVLTDPDDLRWQT
jgi:hypothetical protein